MKKLDKVNTKNKKRITRKHKILKKRKTRKQIGGIATGEGSKEYTEEQTNELIKKVEASIFDKPIAVAKEKYTLAAKGFKEAEAGAARVAVAADKSLDTFRSVFDSTLAMKDQKDVQDQKRINLYKTLQKSRDLITQKRWNCENISADDIAQSAGQVRIENMSNENYVKIYVTV